MKTIFLAAIMFNTFILSAFAETIRVGTEGAYPPYNFINDKGEVDGFERQVGDELCKRAKLDCIWVTNDWNS